LKIDVEARRGAAEMLRAARCVYFEVSGKHFGLFRYDIRTVLNVQHDVDHSTAGVENLIAVRNLVEFAERTRRTVA